MSASSNDRLIASASGDSNVRLWDTSQIVESITNDEKRNSFGNVAGTGVVAEATEIECLSILRDHEKDVYSVKFQPRGNALVSAGYDRSIRLYDVETGDVLKWFDGHRGAISSVTFNSRGNMIVSGSKDSTIKFWDVMSGLCVRTISSHLGEVTSVETNQSDTMSLSSSKDNSNRLWDMRMSRADGCCLH